MGIVISFCNNKGGVGKTASTCNIGMALAQGGHKVLVIDNDSQSNASDLLKNTTNLTQGLYDLYDDSLDNKNTIKIEEIIYQTRHHNLFLLPNDEITSGIEMEMSAKYPESLLFLKKIRPHVTKTYDFTLIDNPPTLGIFVGNSLYTSDFIIVPVDSESIHSLKGLRNILELIESIQKAGNKNLRFLRILINRIDRRTKIGKILLNQIREKFKGKYFKTTIPQSTAFKGAEYKSETIMEKAPGSKGAIAYRNLTKELVNMIKAND